MRAHGRSRQRWSRLAQAGGSRRAGRRRRLPALLAVVSTGSGIAVLWYAVRIAIDRRLFATLARAVDGDGAIDGPLAALDRALADLGWIDAAKVGRTLDARVRGAVGLCRAAVLVAIVQWLVVGIAVAVSPIG